MKHLAENLKFARFLRPFSLTDDSMQDEGQFIVGKRCLRAVGRWLELVCLPTWHAAALSGHVEAVSQCDKRAARNRDHALYIEQIIE